MVPAYKALECVYHFVSSVCVVNVFIGGISWFTHTALKCVYQFVSSVCVVDVFIGGISWFPHA